MEALRTSLSQYSTHQLTYSRNSVLDTRDLESGTHGSGGGVTITSNKVSNQTSDVRCSHRGAGDVVCSLYAYFFSPTLILSLGLGTVTVVLPIQALMTF